MFITKFWTLLLSLAIGVLLAIVLLAKDLVNRERAENATAVLFKEMTKVDIALNLHARKRADILLSVAVDPDIRRMLTTASGGEDKAAKVREKLLITLRNRNKDLGKYSADMLMALDRNGNVVAQLGRGERQHSYSMVGWPLVDAALRGYVRDDVWKLDNEIYLMAARPVIDQGRYIGAIVHGMKLSDKLATEISPGVQVAFFAGNMIVAVSTPKERGTLKVQSSYIAQPIGEVLRDPTFREKGYSDVQRVSTQDGVFLAVFSRSRGEAADNDVGFALVVPIQEMSSPAEFYESAGSQDVEALPMVWLIVGVLLMFGLGWGWNYLEGHRPLSRLLRQIKALEKSDPKDHLNVYRFRRRIRKIAVAFNAVLEYKMRSITEGQGKGKSIDSILGDRDARLSSASFKFAEPDAEDIPVAPPVTGPQAAIPAAPQKPEPPRQTGKTPTPPPAGPAGAPPAPGAPPAQTPAGGVEALAPLSPEEEQKYFHEIYDQFVALKQKLGEPTEQLTFQRFEGTLKKNRDTLMARYGCKRVKFAVYEKDGKASLKATPVKG